MDKTIQIMLIEDSEQYTEAIRMALEEEQDLDLSACFGTTEIAIRSLNRKTVPDPDVILLDLRLPGRGGLEAVEDLLKLLPEVKIIILTQSDNEEDVLKAVTRGASGYLLKSARVSAITSGIRAVAKGGASLDPNIASFVVKSLKSYLPTVELDRALSDRELEILALLGDGLVKKEIAERLSIGYTTVDTHVRHIYTKLQVRNAPEAGSARRIAWVYSIPRNRITPLLSTCIIPSL